MIKTIGLKKDPKALYSRVSDVLYLLFDDNGHVKLGADVPGINLDYDAQGRLVGVEVLNASQLLKEFIRESSAAIKVR